MITNISTKRILSEMRVTIISESFTHKMAAKTSWRRYGTKLRHCYPMCRDHIGLNTTAYKHFKTFVQRMFLLCHSLSFGLLHVAFSEL